MSNRAPMGWRKLRLDIILLVLTFTVMAFRLTGITLHEWLSVGFYLILVWHLCLNWEAVWGVAKRFFKKGMPWQARFNFVWNILLFVMMTFVMVSGLLISRDLLPRFGVSFTHDPFMSYVHKHFPYYLCAMLGVHFGMHWRWFVSNFRRFCLPAKKAAEAVAAQVEKSRTAGEGGAE